MNAVIVSYDADIHRRTRTATPNTVPSALAEGVYLIVNSKHSRVYNGAEQRPFDSHAVATSSHEL